MFLRLQLDVELVEISSAKYREPGQYRLRFASTTREQKHAGHQRWRVLWRSRGRSGQESRHDCDVDVRRCSSRPVVRLRRRLSSASPTLHQVEVPSFRPRHVPRRRHALRPLPLVQFLWQSAARKWNSTSAGAAWLPGLLPSQRFSCRWNNPWEHLQRRCAQQACRLSPNCAVSEQVCFVSLIICHPPGNVGLCFCTVLLDNLSRLLTKFAHKFGVGSSLKTILSKLFIQS